MNDELIKDKLMDIYNKMYRHFGPRHWWPADTPFGSSDRGDTYPKRCMEECREGYIELEKQ